MVADVGNGGPLKVQSANATASSYVIRYVICFGASIGQDSGDEFVEHPIVFLCMNGIGGVWLFFGIDLLRKALTGDSRTSEEGVRMTSVPDLVSGLMLTILGGCFCLGSFIWI
ncbi:hypothetical protein [Salinibacter ruber]|uniref:hypothetical protein n=1 Tax=Salinibacter ruber TaxID=146919 RepID=UPI00216817BF|nr:hypothetical protein [Salinibacter ruber]